MATLHDLVTVETTYEVSEKGWIYRIVVDRDHLALIKRTREKSPLWSHGLLMEIYDQRQGKFVPAMSSDMKNARVFWNIVVSIINRQEFADA